MTGAFGQETDNREFHQRAGSVEGRLVARFRRRLLGEVVPLGPRRALSAGCGEGHGIGWLLEALPHGEGSGVDERADAVAAGCGRNPSAVGVTGVRYLACSVAGLGSTPGHRWTWSRRRLVELVGARAEPVRWRSLFPWQAVLARPR